MTELMLSTYERSRLIDLIAHTNDARFLRRAYAALWFDEGESATEIAEQLNVSRQSVYNWLERFEVRSNLPIAHRLSDADRSGRPITLQGIIDPLIDAIIDTDPQKLGYRTNIWTAPLLGRYLAEHHRITASVPSIRLTLTRLAIHWKRPRHSLALRPETWRQAKGG